MNDIIQSNYQISKYNTSYLYFDNNIYFFNEIDKEYDILLKYVYFDAYMVNNEGSNKFMVSLNIFKLLKLYLVTKIIETKKHTITETKTDTLSESVSDKLSETVEKEIKDTVTDKYYELLKYTEIFSKNIVNIYDINNIMYNIISNVIITNNYKNLYNIYMCIKNYITNIKDTYTFFLTGWGNGQYNKSGHAIASFIIKKNETEYELFLCNSGAGLENVEYHCVVRYNININQLYLFIYFSFIMMNIKLFENIDKSYDLFENLTKNTIINNTYRLLKIDHLDNQPISEKIKNEVRRYIYDINSNALVFSDFRHGIFNNLSIDFFLEKFKKKTFKVADSQVASRWGNISDFHNFDLITPNEKEARFALSDQDSSISHLSRKLIKKTKCKNLILKLSSKGIFSVQNSKTPNSFAIPSFAKTVVDPVGSGDALLAYSTLAFLASNSLIQASIIGNIAAACECELDGNIPITVSSVKKKIDDIEKNFNYSIS